MSEKKNTNKKDFSSFKNKNLRQTYNYYKKKTGTIPDELNAELAKRFPNYNLKTQTFSKGKKTSKTWKLLSDKQLKNAFYYRKNKGYPITPELNAELTKRFSNYDIKTETFNKTLKAFKPSKNWSKCSNSYLKNTYYKIKKSGNTIPENLNIELAKRFPKYNPQNQTFIKDMNKRKKEKIVWDHLSIKQLNDAFRYRKKMGYPITPELNAELAKRFSNYDPDKQIFNKQRLKNKLNFYELTDMQLKNAFYYRKNKGYPITPELNAELTKRFSNYDPQTQTLKKQKAESNNLNFSELTDIQLKNKLFYLKRKKAIIPDKLNTELAKRFPNNYDENTQNFNRSKKDEKTQNSESGDNFNWENLSTDGLKSMYKYYRKRKLPIPDGLSAELENRFPNYKIGKRTLLNTKKTDNNIIYQKRLKNLVLPLFSISNKNGKYDLFFENDDKKIYLLKSSTTPYDLCLIDENNKIVIVRKGVNNNSYSFYAINIEHGTVVYDYKNGSNFIYYSAETHEIFSSRTENGGNTPISKHITTKKNSDIPAYLKTMQVNNIKKTIYLSEDNKEIHCPLITIENIQNNKPNIIKLSVQIKQNTNYYNDIFVNGEKILSNHKGTKIKLFAEGTILAIHGTLTDSDIYPATPQWLVYDTQLNQRASNIPDFFTKKPAQIENVTETNKSVILYMSTKANCLLDIKKLKKLAGMQRFVIEKQR